MFANKKIRTKTLNAGESDLFRVGPGEGLSFIATGTGSIYKLDPTTQTPALLSTYTAGASIQYGPYSPSAVLQIVNTTGSIQVTTASASEGLIIQAKILKAGDYPAVGDKVYPVLPVGWNASGGNLLINRGSGFVTLNAGLGAYTLQSADIAPVGTNWPIIAQATPSIMSSQNLDMNRPPSVPDAPTIGAATAGNGQAAVSWTAPANNGGFPITSYLMYAITADGTVIGPQTATVSPMFFTGLDNGVSYVFRVLAVNQLGPGPLSAASNAVVPTMATPSIISISERQGIPSNMGGFNGPLSQTYRIWDNALQAVDAPSMWFFNWSSFPLITGKQQEQPNISPVIVATSFLTNTVGTALDQSAATLTINPWSKAMAGTPGFILQLVGNTAVTPSAATFAAAGGALLDSGNALRVPGGFAVRCDTADNIIGLRGTWARQVELSGVAPVTLTVTAGTYAAGTPLVYTSGTPVNNWTYLATGTGVPSVQTNFDDSTGTVATVDNAGVVTLSKAFTSTGGTITLTSRVPGGVTVAASNARGDASCNSSSARGKGVREKNWSLGSVGAIQTNGAALNDMHAMIGTNNAGLGCFLLHGTSLENGQNDFAGNATGATGMWRRAFSINRIPSIKTAVSSSSLQYEVPSGAFPGAAFGPMKMFLASYCTDILGSPYNTRNFQWAGSITVSGGAKLLVQSFNKAYRLVCRGGDANVWACSMLPGCSGTFTDAAGQIPSTQNLDVNYTQQQQRIWVNSPGTWNRANGDPDFGLDILPDLYSLAAANGMTMPGATVADSIISQKWPSSPDWVAGGTLGPTQEGVHENPPVATYSAPALAAKLPVYPA